MDNPDHVDPLAEVEEDFGDMLAQFSKFKENPTGARNPAPRRTQNQTKKPKGVYNSGRVRVAFDQDKWDDTELIDAWDQAKADFQRYLADAKDEPTERYEPPTKQWRQRNVQNLLEERVRKRGAVPADDGEEEEEEGEVDPTANPPSLPKDDNKRQRVEEPTDDPTTHPHPHPPIHPPIDPSQLGDQDLSNMLMAWYYAGYYTALYQSKKES